MCVGGGGGGGGCFMYESILRSLKVREAGGMAFGDRFLQLWGRGVEGVTGRKAGFSGVKKKNDKTCKKEIVP